MTSASEAVNDAVPGRRRPTVTQHARVTRTITQSSRPKSTRRPGVRPHSNRPFAQICQGSDGGSDGDRLSVLELFAPRCVAVPDIRPLPRPRRGGSGVRYSLRARKLTLAEESAIRSLAATKSLRSLAAEFGVSHETVPAVLGRRHGGMPTRRAG